MILINQVKCPLCNDVITSHHRHDCRHCSCGKTMTDGGRDYLRCSINAIDLCVYDDGTHETRRQHLTWGSRGRCGTKPLFFNLIKDLEDDHIEAILRDMKVEGLVLKTIAAEQEFRKRR